MPTNPALSLVVEFALPSKPTRNQRFWIYMTSKQTVEVKHEKSKEVFPKLLQTRYDKSIDSTRPRLLSICSSNHHNGRQHAIGEDRWPAREPGAAGRRRVPAVGHRSLLRQVVAGVCEGQPYPRKYRGDTNPGTRPKSDGSLVPGLDPECLRKTRAAQRGRELGGWTALYGRVVSFGNPRTRCRYW
jgi:hypothetical protein